MDEAKISEARQHLRELVLELEQAAAAGRAALAATNADQREESWKQVQALYARFDEATRQLKDMRRSVDEAFAPR
jgi:hypothetical protein